MNSVFPRIDSGNAEKPYTLEFLKDGDVVSVSEIDVKKIEASWTEYFKNTEKDEIDLKGIRFASVLNTIGITEDSVKRYKENYKKTHR